MLTKTHDLCELLHWHTFNIAEWDEIQQLPVLDQQIG